MGGKHNRSMVYFLSGDFLADWGTKALDALLEKRWERHWRQKARLGGFEDQFDAVLADWKARSVDRASHAAFVETRRLGFEKQSNFISCIKACVESKSRMAALSLAFCGVTYLVAKWDGGLPGSSLVLAASVRGSVMAVSTFAALCCAWHWLRLTDSDRNWAAAERALRSHDEIYEGRRWTGKDVTLVAGERSTPRSEPGPVGVTLICRTQSGVWIAFEVLVRSGRVLSSEVRVLSLDDARFWLERHERAYQHWFGVPPAA